MHSKFVRVSIYIVAILILTLISYSFFQGEPKYQISTEIITLILILVVLFLSESFNNLSIGKVLTLSKDNEKKKEENKDLKTENTELRTQLISIATNVNQSQVTYNGLSPELLKALNVVPAEENAKEAKKNYEKETVEEERLTKVEQSTAVTEKTEIEKLLDSPSKRMKLTRLLEPEVISRFSKSIGINPDEIRHEVKFASALEGLDPIMENSIIFDGYYQLEEKELFFEVIRSDMLRPDRLYYLYQMLTKLYLYRKAKKSSAELILILIDFPKSIQSKYSGQYRGIERLKSQFIPAIANKLLRIETIKYTEEEIIDILKTNDF